MGRPDPDQRTQRYWSRLSGSRQFQTYPSFRTPQSSPRGQPADKRERDYRARTYRQTCAPLLALAVDSSVNGIAFPSSAKIVFPPPRMIGSIVSNNSSTRSAASNDRTIVALPYT